MNNEELISWLLEGDVSIQYQTYRDLLGEDRVDLQKRIANEGWGLEFLKRRKKNGQWGDSFYQPKWISTHYTLLDLRHLCLDPGNEEARESIDLILEDEKGIDGGINPFGQIVHADVCVNGMFLNYASYFGAKEGKMNSVIDFLISQKMPDGGFNCMLNRSGAKHSSLHSTLSVLEGFHEYLKSGYEYRAKEIMELMGSSTEFILQHQLYKSDRTGNIINKAFLKFPFPGRWKYDVLRCMDYFQNSNTDWDPRMSSAYEYILSKRNKKGTWNMQAKHPGLIHFEMEKAGKPGRWNTLRCLRVLRLYHDMQCSSRWLE
jgi:hypothetical protein